MTPLSILTLAMLGQADAFTLHFEGFVSTREMNQQQLTKMFRGAFEAVSDEPESLFAVSDSPNADVLASASQTLDEEGLLFHWSLSTTRCPIRHLEFDQRRPKHALTFDETKVMVREVAHKAHELLHGHAGEAGLACLEEGQSMGGTVTLASESDGLPMSDTAYPGVGYSSFGFGYRNGSFITTTRASTSTNGSTGTSVHAGNSTGFPGTTTSFGTSHGYMPGGPAIPSGGGVHSTTPTGSASGPKPVSGSIAPTGASLPRGGAVGGTTAHTHH
ncbi:MAG: hypothetical protein QM723_28410 [Myxococcaceae bacterium]